MRSPILNSPTFVQPFPDNRRCSAVARIRIRATAEHRLLSGKGWTKVGELRIGDRMALARQLPEPKASKRWPEHWLILLGHLVGDGSYVKHQPLRYTTASEENSVLVRIAAEKLGRTALKR